MHESCNVERHLHIAETAHWWKDKAEPSPLSVIGRYVHKQPSIIRALIGIKTSLSLFFPLLCWAESHYYRHCSNRVKGLLMHAEGASVRPLSVSDGNCDCDPQHSDRCVCRDKEQNLTLMAQPDEISTLWEDHSKTHEEEHHYLSLI